MMISDNLLQKFNIVDWGYTEEGKASSYSNFEEWIDQNKHANLSYLADERKEKRKHLKEVFHEFKSALVFLFDYSSSKKTLDESSKGKDQKIAGYTFGFEGSDYHYFVKDALTEIIKSSSLPNDHKIIVDTAPVLDRDLAYRAGLGWFGKNSMLISKKHGSYVMIGSILFAEKLNINLRELESDHCGNCTACISACPTFAIDPVTRTVDSEKCIPNFTIEIFKDGQPPPFYDGMDEIFGCDICQEVCPWNRKPINNANEIKLSETQQNIFNFFVNKSKDEIIDELNQMSKKGYQKRFKGTSFERTGRDGILKNLKHK